MPINYKLYPKNWKSEIRPAILQRAHNKCEFCGVPNHIAIFRGTIDGKDVYQTIEGDVFDAENSKYLFSDFYAEIKAPAKRKAIKVVLTVAHLDHDTTNNDPENIKALCQRCHNRYDMKQRVHNRKKKSNELELI